ncbi:MAG: 3-dehydroquinate synthase [Candidatus Omnitrophota bacterium]
MSALHVRLGERSYPIFIGSDILSRAGRLLKDRVASRNALIVSQKEIPVHTQHALRESLSREGFETGIFLTPQAKSSEAAKSQAVYSQLIKKMAAMDGKNKSLVLVAVGGGVIGDLTGFAASVYRRGVPYAQVPTTLTAQVDSAIGGKTGIDLPEGKNLLGSIYQPIVVLSDVSVLHSLPGRHWSDGFAEVIKYGVIRDAALFSLLEKNGKDGVRTNARLLEKVILRCARIKAKVVEKDEFDKKDVRIILNYGHTAGHAIEAASRFTRQYTHGEAVAVGMLVAAHIAEELGVLKDKTLTPRLEKTLLKFELPIFYKGVPTDLILKAIGYDKKAEAGANRFVLPVAMGKVTVVKNIPTAVIVRCLEKRKN